MSRITKLSLAAAALLAVLCSGAWAADIALKDGLKEWTNGNNYTVTGHVLMGDRIEVKGSVTLTLNDGCELNARGGIHVPGGSSLTIKTPSGQVGTGKLNAQCGGPDAGIGGNKDASTGTIRIEGGVISAKGGYASAGIGGGMGCGNGTIIITGGTIDTQGQTDGAGIGGGERGHGGSIRIEGGNINARGGMMAAGIGGGQHRNAGDITITGGTIYARGGEWAAGIGGGDSGYIGGPGGNDISISGGKITAIGGGRGGYGIGAGDRSDGGRLTSEGNGSAWIETDTIKTDTGDLRSGVLIVGNEGTVYGSPTIRMDAELKKGKTLKIDSGRTLTVGKGVALTLAHGAAISTEGGGRVRNDGSIVNNGIVRLAASGTINDIKAIKMTGRGVVEMGGSTYNNYGGGALRGNRTLSGDITHSETLAVMEDSTLTIPQGVTLTLNGSPAMVNFGQIVNMGTVRLPAGRERSEIKKIGIQDDMAKDVYGIVKIGDAEYASDGGDIVRGTKTLRSITTITNGTWRLMDGARLIVDPYVYMNIRPGQRLIVHDGARLTISKTSHGIRNEGIMRLPAGTDIPALKLGGPGYILMGGKTYSNKGEEVEVNVAMPKLTTADENDAVTNAVNKFVHTDGARGLRAADEQDPMDGMVVAQMGDILIYKNGEDGELCTMTVDVNAQANEFAVIAKGQMGDAEYGDVKAGTIIYFAHFVDPNDETRTQDVKFDEGPADGTEELDLTTVVVNGKASPEVRAMPEYIPSGLVDGQGLVVYYDEETSVYVLIIFDGSETDDIASAHILAKQASGGGSGGSSGCGVGSGMAAIAGLAALALRRRNRQTARSSIAGPVR